MQVSSSFVKVTEIAVLHKRIFTKLDSTIWRLALLATLQRIFIKWFAIGLVTIFMMLLHEIQLKVIDIWILAWRMRKPAKEKTSSDSIETVPRLCVCGLACQPQDMEWMLGDGHLWGGGQENESLTCHICAKSTNAKFQWVLQEHIKISYFVPLFENRMSAWFGGNLGGPL